MLRLWSWLWASLPFPLLIQNFAMMNGQCKQTNHRYSISVLLRICIIPLYHYRACSFGNCPNSDVPSGFLSTGLVSPLHSVFCVLNPNCSGPLCPEPVQSAAPELATAYPLRDIAIYEQYVLQMTGSNFLPKIKLTLSFINDSNKIAV